MSASFIPVILLLSTIRGTVASPSYYHMDLEKRIEFSNADSTTTKKETSTKKEATTTKASSSKPTSSAPSTISSTNPTLSQITTTSTTSSSSNTMLIASTTTTTTTTTTSSPMPSAASDTNSSGGISGGAIGGIIAAIVIIIAGIVAYLFVRRRANQKQRNIMNNNPRFSKAAFSQQPPMQQQYQHQYGTNVNSPPTSPFSFNEGDDDANQHIITPTTMQQPMIQQYQPAIAEQYNYNDVTPQEVVVAAPANTSTTTTVAKMQPTQPGSLGVYTVIATYTPTLSDEVDIQAGDQVEVLVEYDDGWCQGINLSRGNAKGVFPKHCTDFGSTNNAAAPPSISSAKRVSSMYIP